MSIDIEDALREAFDQLPDDRPDAAEMTHGAISRAKGLRRRRSLLIGGGVTATAAALVAASLVGAALRSRRCRRRRN